MQYAGIAPDTTSFTSLLRAALLEPAEGRLRQCHDILRRFHRPQGWESVGAGAGTAINTDSTGSTGNTGNDDDKQMRLPQPMYEELLWMWGESGLAETLVRQEEIVGYMGLGLTSSPRAASSSETNQGEDEEKEKEKEEKKNQEENREEEGDSFVWLSQRSYDALVLARGGESSSNHRTPTSTSRNSKENKRSNSGPTAASVRGGAAISSGSAGGIGGTAGSISQATRVRELLGVLQVRKPLSIVYLYRYAFISTSYLSQQVLRIYFKVQEDVA